MSITPFNTEIRQTHSRHWRNNGFTLIEVLVTIVVVSIGLLGLAGLQISGLRANMSSEARSKATLLSNDIVERMRANPLGVAAGAYNGIAASEDICAGAPPEPLCSSVDSICTEIEMAAFDAWTWGCETESGITSQLPRGIADVVCADNNPDDSLNCSPGSPNTVTVSWNEFSPSATGTTAAGEDTLQTITLIVIP